MMHVGFGKGEEHAEKLKAGLSKLGPNFLATICWWCNGTTMRKFDHCDICGKGKFYGSGLGLLIATNPSHPASESVVNQVLVAAEKNEN